MSKQLTGHKCPSRPEFCDSPVYHGTMGGYYVGNDYGYNDAPVEILFATDRLDNIQIHSLSPSQTMIRPPRINDSYDTGRDIPEPASLALLGIGAAAFAARRRHGK